MGKHGKKYLEAKAKIDAEAAYEPVEALTLVKEMPDSLFDQLIAALIPATSEFLLDLLSQIGW